MADAYYAGLIGAVGHRGKDLKNPVIGIANSWNDATPGYKPFKELVNYAQEGIWTAEGAPAGGSCSRNCSRTTPMGTARSLTVRTASRYMARISSDGMTSKSENSNSLISS